jgi:hypothetical protein
MNGSSDTPFPPHALSRHGRRVKTSKVPLEAASAVRDEVGVSPSSRGELTPHGGASRMRPPTGAAYLT